MPPPPTNKTQEVTSPKNMNQQVKPKVFHFQYKDVIYDCTDYAKKHPGGIEFLEKFVTEKQDLTEYFQCLHSEQAEKVIKSFQVVGTKPSISKDAQNYEVIRKRVEPLYEPNWVYEFLLVALNLTTLLIGTFCQNWFIAILVLGYNQTLAGWNGHSWLHSRNKGLILIGNSIASILGGLSPTWWSRKHNLHHIFTNHIGKDEDIQHSYNRFLFPLLFIKWKYDSIMTELKKPTIIFIIIHWYIVLHQNLIVILIANLISGFFTAVVLVGNHEKERIFIDKIGLPFLEHQIVASRNYDYHGFFWVMMMGGMQYQTEHHFFPQIPYYNLPKASKIIKEELEKIKLKICVGPVW